MTSMLEPTVSLSSTAPDFLTLAEAAAVLRVGRSTAYREANAFEASGGTTGIRVTQDSLVEAVTTLHEIAAHEPDNGTRQLANVIHEWAEQHCVELTRPPVQQHRTIETGIEIDL